MASSLSETRSRDAARTTLQKMWVQAPDHIEVNLFASQAGLSVIEGGLETADGRIVAGRANEGFIRIKSGIHNPGRRRFVVAHELGHFHLHKRQSYTDTVRELSDYTINNLEAEANIYAAELLMPDFLFEKRIHGQRPSHALLQKLAEDFSTSHLATIIQFLTYTEEPCALVFTKDASIQWSRKSENWEFYIRGGRVHPDSGAGEYFGSGVTPNPGMIKTPAGAWLTQFSPTSDETIREDVFVWPQWHVALSLLWVDDVL